VTDVVDNDSEYLERTAGRLRAMSAAQVALVDADADEVRSRLENMSYGHTRQRKRASQPSSHEAASVE
jgi:hypothetical protein